MNLTKREVALNPYQPYPVGRIFGDDNQIMEWVRVNDTTTWSECQCRGLRI